MRNGKIREYLQDCHDKRNNDGDSRQGIAAVGASRWSSRNDQINMQISLRPDLAAACIDNVWSRYIKPDVKSIILNIDHWNTVQVMQRDVTQFHISIKVMQGMIDVFVYYLLRLVSKIMPK